MPANDNISFSLSAPDLDAIQDADKATVKLAADPAPTPVKGDFSASNCRYKECLPRQ